jgi:CBS domain-containing protein
MRALEIMTRPVFTAHPWTPVQEAAAILTKHAITALPVLDAEHRLVGMVSEGDLLWHRVPADPDVHLSRRPDDAVTDPPGTVGDVMTTAVVTMPTGASTADLAEAMLQYDVRSIPIVDGPAVVGIVSRRDLLRTLVRNDDVIAADVREALDAYAGGEQRWHADVADGVVTVSGPFTDQAEVAVVRILAKSVGGVLAVHLRPTTAS